MKGSCLGWEWAELLAEGLRRHLKVCLPSKQIPQREGQWEQSASHDWVLSEKTKGDTSYQRHY